MSAGYRTAFITGASSGIGEALARRMAASGIEVALAARNVDALERIADRIRKEGGKARVYALDVSDNESVEPVLLRADDDMHGVDVVVANAGVGKARWSGKLRWSDCKWVIDVNVSGAIATLVALLPRMVERNRGHLVGVSSLAQYRGLPRNAVYCASKAFLSHFLESVRVDLQKTEIAITDIRPGYVKTAMTAHNDSMPFVLSADRAADTVFDAIVAKKAVHGFPLPMVAAIRSVATLPNGLFDRLAGRLGPG